MNTLSSRRYTFISGRYRTDVLDQLSIPRRIELHRRAGAWLKNNPGQDPHGNVPRLARHFEQAGELEEASRYWYEAGAIARRQGSHQIALKNFRRAQVLHKALAPSPGRELEAAIICSALGREIVVTEGLNAPDANRLFRRAFELSQDVPDSPELAQVLWRLWVFQLSRGPLESAQELAGRLLNIARRMESPEILVAAHHAGWGTAFMQGDLPRVQEHTRECIAVCGSGLNESSTLTNGCTLHDAHLSDHNIAICGGFFSAWVDAISGEKERASKSLDAVIAHARDIRHPFTLALALAMSAGALASSGNSGLTRLRADECRLIARRHGFYALAAWSAIYSGWSLVQLGDSEEGISLLEDGLTAAGKFGMRLFRPFHLALAAEAQIRCNRLGEASKSLAEAFSVSEKSGHRFGLSELYRLRGELNLMIAGEKDSRPKAVRDLQAAVDIAAASGASCWEERARAKLSRVSELHASSL